MKYVQLGNTGLCVSQLTLGAMTFDHEDGMFGKMIGGTSWSTYPSMPVSSTPPTFMGWANPRSLTAIRECENSLRRLGTDWIDLYQVHSFDYTTPLEETLRALDALVQQGKVRYIGLSNYSAKADGICGRLGFCSSSSLLFFGRERA